MELRAKGAKEIIAKVQAVEQVDPVGVLESIGREVHRLIIQGFERQADPWGRPWQPLSPVTIERKGSSRILEDTGRLRQSITWRVIGREAVAAGTNVEYAPVHQFGWPEQHIPKRPFLPLATDGARLPLSYRRAVMDILEDAYGFPA